MVKQRVGAVLGPLRESRGPDSWRISLTLSVSPRVRGATQETLGWRWTQLLLHICLSVFVCVSVFVWLCRSLPPLLELSFLDTDPLRAQAPFPWQVTDPPKAMPLHPHLPTLSPLGIRSQLLILGSGKWHRCPLQLPALLFTPLLDLERWDRQPHSCHCQGCLLASNSWCRWIRS